jgi:hypothetical protein
VGGIQPSVLEKQLLGDPAAEDGLWARFVWYRLPMTTPPGISDKPDFDLSQQLRGIYHSLNQLEAKTYTLSTEGKRLWNEWNSEIGQLIKQEPLGILRATYPKLKEVPARIALITHIVNAKLLQQPVEESVSGDTLRNAIEFTRWLMGQTKMLYCEIGTSDNPEAVRYIKFVNRFKGCGLITAKQVRAWWSGKTKPNTQSCREFMAKVVALGYASSNDKACQDSDYKIEIRSHLVTDAPQKHTQQEPEQVTNGSHPVVTLVTSEFSNNQVSTKSDYGDYEVTNGSHPENAYPVSDSAVVTKVTTVLGERQDVDPNEFGSRPDFSIGASVKKRHATGWRGVVKTAPINGKVDVLWQGDRYPSCEQLSDLEAVA